MTCPISRWPVSWICSARHPIIQVMTVNPCEDFVKKIQIGRLAISVAGSWAFAFACSVFGNKTWAVGAVLGMPMNHRSITWHHCVCIALPPALHCTALCLSLSAVWYVACTALRGAKLNTLYVIISYTV
jgi:hypothetical protein